MARVDVRGGLDVKTEESVVAPDLPIYPIRTVARHRARPEAWASVSRNLARIPR